MDVADYAPMAQDIPSPTPAEAGAATPPAADTPRRPTGCVGLLVLGFLLFGLGSGVIAWRFVRSFGLGMDWLRAGLVTQNINETFRESVTRIASTNGDILEVATLETDETVTKYDVKSLFNQSVYLGTTVAEIRVPVVYRYHIRLSEGWTLRVENGQCIVHAPAMHPSQPPAIRTQAMEKKSEAGWFRFNAAESLAELEKSLTPTLEKRAGNRSHLNLVREPARKSVAEFVKKWVLSQNADALGSNSIRSITVVFPDELPPPGANGPLTLPPTVKLD